MATKKRSKKRTKPKKAVRRKPAAKKPRKPKKKVARKATPRRRAARGKTAATVRAEFPRRGLGAASGGQSGDLQGLSDIAGADSESVEELIEEGNSLEAEVIKGVQDADDADESEVVTHEVPEDDVPGEYLDEK